ncbi:putative glucosamine-6-phosphate deaminase-like protein [Ehrlichia ruminantium]|uniref:Putative glucosamine-6-phosphate deaminase-like protein n=1 Tax=Ehrlichia ruminantium TaxID=779 RepID=A0A161MLR5_EHRRU|nr:hypothetical protein [Ehrlichia ruminantium]GAT75513.1 putative glucosamine-6-phosphate deaminase-like protein [Ehrlichia ruminantium]GAT77496.1 putative glucosamine-6-phosphate deaminase-like protein [Ehrlichia ruminantium]
MLSKVNIRKVKRCIINKCDGVGKSIIGINEESFLSDNMFIGF